ncbi:MAG: phytanoyl-CoA dioxygenase family protein [Chitinophagales bacterium]
MNWTPQLHKIIKSNELRNTLHEEGCAVEGNIGAENIYKLYSLYEELHHFNTPQGGNFYSLYSDDLAYRKKVHDTIGQVLYPVYNLIFENYKSVINSFIIKVPGPQSEFTLHQDSSGLDELKHSPLSLWIPLQDTTLENGTLCVVPKSHRFFYPYRGISFAAPFAQYEDLLRTYLRPIHLKAGDLFMFDNRLVHYSHLNKSTANRVVVMSGLFPVEAGIESCYQDESVTDSPIEIYSQTEDFLLTNTAFFNDCTARPTRGEVVRKISSLPAKSKYDWMSFAAANEVSQTFIDELINVKHAMNIVSEPT